jgi:hypothetical protein
MHRTVGVLKPEVLLFVVVARHTKSKTAPRLIVTRYLEMTRRSWVTPIRASGVQKEAVALAVDLSNRCLA